MTTGKTETQKIRDQEEAARKAVVLLHREIPTLKERAESIEIRNQKDADEAAFFIGSLNDKIRVLSPELEGLKKVAYASYRKTADFVDGVFDPVKEVIAIVKAKIAAFLTEVNRKKAEDAAKILKENAKIEERGQKEMTNALKKGDFKAAHKIDTKIEALKKDVPQESTVSGACLVDNWIWEVIDQKLIPEMYYKPRELDSVLINRTVKAQKDKAVIPGLKIYNKPGLRFQ